MKQPLPALKQFEVKTGVLKTSEIVKANQFRNLKLRNNKQLDEDPSLIIYEGDDGAMLGSDAHEPAVHKEVKISIQRQDTP